MSSVDIVLMPDIEQLVVGFLLDQSELASVDERIYTELPKEKVFPAVRVHQFNDAQATERTLWLMRYSLQIDVWGGTKNQARDIADTIRALLDARVVGTHAEGVVSGVITRGLDTTADGTVPTKDGKARPRCRFDVDIWAHPAPDVGS